MEEKVAIIDCGTNTFHLMIADVSNDSIHILLKEKVAVKIGEGGINQQIIQPAAYERALNALDYFAAKITEFGVDRAFGFATSAFRNAKNGESLKNEIIKRTGIEIEIISGNQEAEFIFKGVDSALHVGDEPALVMDIGGGSVEFIIGTSNDIFWKQSFEIGAQRLVDLFHQNDPISLEEIAALNQYLGKQLKPLFDALQIWQPKILIGSSGTFDTLSDIFCRQQGFIKNGEAVETPLTLLAVRTIHYDLIAKNKEERMKIPGMIPLRVDMIVVASCLIDFILNKHTFNKIRVSTYALKEGVLSELLKGELK